MEWEGVDHDIEHHVLVGDEYLGNELCEDDEMRVVGKDHDVEGIEAALSQKGSD